METVVWSSESHSIPFNPCIFTHKWLPLPQNMQSFSKKCTLPDRLLSLSFHVHAQFVCVYLCLHVFVFINHPRKITPLPFLYKKEMTDQTTSPGKIKLSNE